MPDIGANELKGAVSRDSRELSNSIKRFSPLTLSVKFFKGAPLISPR